MERDWTTEELRGFLHSRRRRIYVHNHVNNWDRDLIADFKGAGYFTFTWVRHPGDAMCSFYHWRISKDGKPAESLNRFIADHIDLGRPWTIPEWWELLDFAAPFSTDRFRDFLRRYFGVDLLGTERANISENRGYEHYRESGEISDEVHQRLQASTQMRRFRRITELHS
jgi:hypothetical protein